MNVLKSLSCLSLCLQDDHLDIVGGIKSVLKSLAEQYLMQWQVAKLVCSRIKDDGEDKVYQGAVLHGYSTSVSSQFATIALRDLNS